MATTALLSSSPSPLLHSRYLPPTSDLQAIKFEEEISRNPFYLKGWLKYLDYKKNSVPTDRYFVYERALKYLPRSYKLWFGYLSLRRARLEYVSINDKRYQLLLSTFERALVHMNKMPVIW
jgi:pre-mRNA-splicing factor SYF1